MAVDKVYIGDQGFILEAEGENPDGDYTLDLSTASVLRYDVIKPDSTTAQWTATVKAGDVSRAQYTIAEGDLDQAGKYLIQLYGEWSGGAKLHGDTFELTVYALGA